MKNNVIPRKATYIKYEVLVSTNAGNAGDIFEAYRENGSWHSRNITKNNGIVYHEFVQHLRNRHFTKFIEVA